MFINKAFHSYVKRYQFLMPHQLYNGERELFSTKFTNSDSTIYFIVRCQASQWLAHSMKTLLNYKLQGSVNIDGRETGVEIDMAEYWYASNSMREKFASKNEMATYFMRRTNGFPLGMLPGHVKYKLLTMVDQRRSTPEVLGLNCELSRNMIINRQSAVDIPIYQAINFFKMPSPKLEIVYVGSSVSGTLDRLTDHEKWGRFQSAKSRDQDLLVYFAEIDSDIFSSVTAPNMNIVHRDKNPLSLKDTTAFSEMSLINYFKPIHNELHVKRHIRKTSRVKKKLKSAGYHSVIVELKLDGSMGALGSQLANQYGNHTIDLQIA